MTMTRWLTVFLMQPLTVAEAAEIGFGEAHREMRRLAIVAPADHLAMGIDPGQRAAIAERHVEPHRAPLGVEPAIDQLQEPATPLPRGRRQRHAFGVAPLYLIAQPFAGRRIQQIYL